MTAHVTQAGRLRGAPFTGQRHPHPQAMHSPGSESDALLVAESLRTPERFAEIYDRYFAEIYGMWPAGSGRIPLTTSLLRRSSTLSAGVPYSTRSGVRYDPGCTGSRPTWLRGTAGPRLAASAPWPVPLRIGIPTIRRIGPPPGSLRTRLLAAFATAGGEVLHMHSTWITGSSASAEQDTWVAPWDAQPGQVQRQRTVIRMATGNPYVLNANSDQDVEMIYTVPASGLSTPSKSESAGVKSNVVGQVIDVEDTARTWSDQPRTPIVIAPAIDDPGQLRSEIAAGDFTVVRHTVVGGQPALELRRTIESPADAGSEGNTAVSYLWVSTSTYLPLKSAFIATQGTAATGHIASDDIVTYEFLPATPANLAKLRPVIPAGFARTAKPPVNLHG